MSGVEIDLNIDPSDTALKDDHLQGVDGLIHPTCTLDSARLMEVRLLTRKDNGDFQTIPSRHLLVDAGGWSVANMITFSLHSVTQDLISSYSMAVLNNG